MKRFKQKKDKSSLKNDNPVKFPLEIDMFPYTSESKKLSTKKQKCFYTLFSVIEHRGTLDSGHYICYIKHNYKWFLCDDEYIYESSTEAVLKCQAYLLFYIRKDI